MGYSSYSVSNATAYRVANNTATASVDSIFTQNLKREVHKKLDPIDIKIRECLDSVEHPQSFPIVLALDVTGSMRQIPHELIKEGLPTLMSTIVQKVPDASLLFLAIGDATCDDSPLQVGQFESGDEELDGWLMKLYLEGGGGGNAGESYPLAWYFSAFHTKTDHFDKRKQKGVLFTIGDEPSIGVKQREIKALMKSTYGQTDFEPAELLAEAQKMYEVYHLHVMQGSAGKSSLAYWKQLLGDHCIEVSDFTEIPKIISDIVVKEAKLAAPTKVEEEVL